MNDLCNLSCLARILAAAAFLALCSLNLFAADSQQLSGTVSDQSGAVVPGATVRIQESGADNAVIWRLC